jgi:hypothetical protein
MTREEIAKGMDELPSSTNTMVAFLEATSLLEGFDCHTADSMAHDHALDITSGILTPANIELFGISAAVRVHLRWIL